jgi:acyl carrier protein
MTKQDAVFDEVAALIADVLDVDVSDVVPTANFFSDLGGESIDLIDLNFRCQKKFGIALSFQEILDPKRLQSGPDGRIANAVVTELRSQLPSLDLSELQAPLDKDQLQGLLIVQVLVDFVRHAIACNELKKTA